MHEVAEELEHITKPGALSDNEADKCIENVIGTYQLPMGVAMNFVIDGQERLIPMVVEEASIVADTLKVCI